VRGEVLIAVRSHVIDVLAHLIVHLWGGDEFAILNCKET
jgi:hypothetical protein